MSVRNFYTAKPLMKREKTVTTSGKKTRRKDPGIPVGRNLMTGHYGTVDTGRPVYKSSKKGVLFVYTLKGGKKRYLKKNESARINNSL